MARPPLHVEARTTQQVAADLRDTLLGYIRGHFYRDLPAERFFADRILLLRFVVLWPAKWLSERGVSLPAERYQAIMVGAGNPRGILIDAATLGEPPRNPVAYLGAVVQRHWQIHGDEYYEEAKSLRPRLEQLVAGLSKATVQPAPQRNAVELLSEAASLVATARRRKTAPKPASQLDLL